MMHQFMCDQNANLSTVYNTNPRKEHARCGNGAQGSHAASLLLLASNVMQVNSSIDNGYEIRRDDNDTKLGSGSYSTVWKGKDRDNNRVCAPFPLLQTERGATFASRRPHSRLVSVSSALALLILNGSREANRIAPKLTAVYQNPWLST